MTKEKIIDSIIEIEGEDNEIQLADGFEDAYIGLVRQLKYRKPKSLIMKRLPA